MINKVVVVGGVAAGMSFATRMRRLHEQCEIIIIEQGEHVSFANCGLPYYVGDVIDAQNKLLLQNPDGLKAKFNLDVRVKQRAIKIDRKNKTLHIQKQDDGTSYTETYDVLVLATGAKPFLPPIPGLDTATNRFTLRDVKDAQNIKDFIQKHQPKRAVVLGGGFIGLEMVENLVDLGITTALVEASDHVMPPFDTDMASYVHHHLRAKGVELYLNNKLEEVLDSGRTLKLGDGHIEGCDLLISSMGVRADSILAKEAELPMTPQGLIVVDKKFHVADGVYAIGDVIAVEQRQTQQMVSIPLANLANRQGRILADILMGKSQGYHGVVGVSVLKIFDQVAGQVGLNERALQAMKQPYHVLHGHYAHHAGYYPGAETMHVKLLFAPDGKIFGMQAVGGEGVDKKLDVISTAITGQLTIYDLTTLELAYAPPFGSAKDIINQLAYAASNILEGKMKTWQAHEASTLLENGEYVLDVREIGEREGDRFISGDHHIALGQLRSRLFELPKDKTIYVYCAAGVRGYNACTILEQSGFDCSNLDGGFNHYSSVVRK
jgi:NADPH-dependent 2,4-dienoyl-CoA reductase/sulfur reductase-like enzyme/rhodanese-related sulfurtransferase